MKTLREIYESDTMAEEIAQAFCFLLGKGCQSKTKALLLGRIKYGSDFKNKWFCERLYLENGEAYYIAGQDYPYEIACIRKEFIK